MAISETSKACSRTIGLKPLLVGEYSAKSSVTRSDLIDPSFSAAVQGWSPSKVRSRIVTSIGLGLVEIDETGLRQGLAHLVHVEPKRACGELLALAVFVSRPLFSLGHDVGDILPADHHDAIVVGNHGIAGHNVDAGTHHGNVDGAERRLDRTLRGNRFRPHWKTHL